MVESGMTAVERLYDLLSEDGTVRGHPEKFVAQCPAHDDGKPSLSVQVGRDGDRAVLKCFAECSTADILAALGLTPSDLFDEPKVRELKLAPTGKPGKTVATYEYRDESGVLLFQVLRTADKQFPQRRPNGSGGWIWSLGDTRRVLYRLPELIEGISKGGSAVYIVEGEKDVHTLVAKGRLATCNPGGAGKWRPEYASVFAGVDVIVCADKDKPGQAHARVVADSLDGVAARVWVVEAADPYKDITEHLNAGLTFNDLVVTVDPSKTVKPDLAPDILDLVYGDQPDYDWLVPDLLERCDRIMITGKEGLGKTFLTRQIAVALATGVHPFTLRNTKPIRVLVIDCENSQRQNRRTYRPIIDQARLDDSPLAQGQLRIIHRQDGLDLPEEEDAAWLLERVTAHAPELLVIGPLYRLHFGNPNDEGTARKVAAALDAARMKAECALLIENHAGHGDPTKAHRQIRPVGSSLWLRWPEFGYGLRPVEDQVEWETDDVTDCDFMAWRGARDEREWPRALQRLPRKQRGAGPCWPWRDRPSDAEIRALAAAPATS
jgi:hypothetical protein